MWPNPQFPVDFVKPTICFYVSYLNLDTNTRPHKRSGISALNKSLCLELDIYTKSMFLS